MSMIILSHSFSNGVGRTGVFIALANLIDRVKSENVISVYFTIKKMRLQRTAMVQTKVSYILECKILRYSISIHGFTF